MTVPTALPDAEKVAYEKGVDAAKRRDYSNPYFPTYSERIWFRAGWLAQKKKELP